MTLEIIVLLSYIFIGVCVSMCILGVAIRDIVQKDEELDIFIELLRSFAIGICIWPICLLIAAVQAGTEIYRLYEIYNRGENSKLDLPPDDRKED